MDNVTYSANEVINGLYGYLYDENGQQLQDTQEFEFKDEYEKGEIKVPGKFHTVHKVLGGKLSGSIKMNKKDSRLQKKVADNPTAKFNYIGKLADPDSKGTEAVLLIGVSFDSNDLIKFTLGELTDVELDFTADDFKYTSWIE